MYIFGLVAVIVLTIIIFIVKWIRKIRSHGNKMTLIVQPINDNVLIDLTGNGKAIIDWGDGSKETHELKSEFWGWDKSGNIKHSYFTKSVHTITITGKDVTRLNCSNIGVEKLDVSKNKALIFLHCSDNQLTSLNVSKNTSLEILYCSKNQLTSLNLIGNIALKELWCGNNQLSAAALDILFGTLNTTLNLEVTKITNKIITILGNPGAYTCNRSIAEVKGWTMLEFVKWDFIEG